MRVSTPRVGAMTDVSPISPPPVPTAPDAPTGPVLRVEQAAAEAGVGVDTVRYYQGMGLLPPVGRDGRNALYGPEHLTRLRTIRALADDGFTLAQIKRLLAETGDPLLVSLVGGADGLSRDELAELSGLDREMVDLAASAGLIQRLGGPDQTDERFAPEAAPMLAAGRTLLEAGFPMHRLAALAARHATGVEEVVDEAIDLFAEYVRPGQSDHPDELARLFRTLAAMVARLVAQHFQQTVFNRTRERLAESDDRALIGALEEAGRRNLVITAEWR